MSWNVKEFTNPRQLQAIRLLSEGMKQREIADRLGLSDTHVSRLRRSEAGVVELARLRLEAEEKLMAALPNLIEASVKELQAQLQHPIAAYRFEAAQFCLRYLARPFLQNIAALKGIADDGGALIEAYTQPIKGEGGDMSG